MRKWSLGCIFADVTFHERDNHDQLVKIAKVLGTQALYEYIKQLHFMMDFFFFFPNTKKN